jgi:hypothetical protein
MAVAASMMACAATPAQACWSYSPPAARLAMGHTDNIFSAIALVRIDEAHYTSAASGDAHPWQASATIQNVLSGTYIEGQVRFDRGWGSSACDDGRPTPEAGSLWVVYFWTHPDGRKLVWMTYPADVAFAADPLLPRPR